MSADLTPFKIVGRLIGTRNDDDGNIVGEEVMGEVAIYATNFGNVQAMVDEAVDAARAAEADEQ